MARISKNIKQYRTEKKLTQDALAEKIKVSRQTVSSWETERTQPDIEMLEGLSTALDVSIEELIYGRKNKVGLEAEKKPNRKLFIIVLTVFGTLMLTAGLVILFSVFWDKISFAKNIFALLPLLAGFCLTYFAKTKKSGSLIWQEASALVWVAGTAVTNALVNSLNDIDFGFYPLMLVDTVLTLLILLVTEGIFPFAAFVAGTTGSLVGLAYDIETVSASLICIVCWIALFTAGVFYYAKRKTDDIRDTFRFWILIAGFFAAVLLFSVQISECDNLLYFGVVITVMLLVCAAAVGARATGYPLQKISLTLLSVITVVLMFVMGDSFDFFKFKEFAVFFTVLTGCIVILIINIKAIAKNPVAVVIIAAATVQCLLLCFADGVGRESRLEMIIGTVPAMCVAVTVIASGVKKEKLSTANLGLVEAGAVAVGIFFILDVNLLIKGAVITAVGIALLSVNAVMMKKLGKESEAKENA